MAHHFRRDKALKGPSIIPDGGIKVQVYVNCDLHDCPDQLALVTAAAPADADEVGTFWLLTLEVVLEAATELLGVPWTLC